MSRPDIGFATIPSVEPGTTGSSPLVTALTSAVHRAAVPAARVAAVLQCRGQRPASARTAGADDAATNELVARSGSTTSTSGASR